MEKFTQVTGIAAPLDIVNIDTDMILPKQFLATVERKGLAAGMFYELRFDENGAEKPDFILNTPDYRNAKIIVAGDNFGCGSSREHAPWALADYGIRCVIAPSFADIFFNNCFKNGLLPLVLPEADVASLMVEAKTGAADFTVDLEARQVRAPSGAVFPFEIDEGRRANLLAGLDEIAETLQFDADIAAFEAKSAA